MNVAEKFCPWKWEDCCSKFADGLLDSRARNCHAPSPYIKTPISCLCTRLSVLGEQKLEGDSPAARDQFHDSKHD